MTEIEPALLDRRQVEARTSLGRNRIYELMATGEFPRPRKLSHRCVRWVAEEVDGWVKTVAAMPPTEPEAPAKTARRLGRAE